MLTAYLAGPITGCSFEECTDWRKKFAELCPSVECFSPLRGEIKWEGERDSDPRADDDLLFHDSGIMTRDYFDCKRCDFIVLNLLEAKRATIGSCMELAWGYEWQKPVITIMEPEGNIHDHPMVRAAISYRVETIEQAAYVARNLA